jgi:hypothetical protein
MRNVLRPLFGRGAPFSSGASALLSSAQIDYNADGLPLGVLPTWSNSGTLGGMVGDFVASPQVFAGPPIIAPHQRVLFLSLGYMAGSFLAQANGAVFGAILSLNGFNRTIFDGRAVNQRNSLSTGPAAHPWQMRSNTMVSGGAAAVGTWYRLVGRFGPSGVLLVNSVSVLMGNTGPQVLAGLTISAAWNGSSVLGMNLSRLMMWFGSAQPSPSVVDNLLKAQYPGIV